MRCNTSLLESYIRLYVVEQTILYCNHTLTMSQYPICLFSALICPFLFVGVRFRCTQQTISKKLTHFCGWITLTNSSCGQHLSFSCFLFFFSFTKIVTWCYTKQDNKFQRINTRIYTKLKFSLVLGSNFNVSVYRKHSTCSRLHDAFPVQKFSINVEKLLVCTYNANLGYSCCK